MIKQQTSNEVTTEAKIYAYTQRKTLADDTRKAEHEWRAEKLRKKEKHLAGAQIYKDDARLSRAKAKQVREEQLQQRHRQAREMREQRVSAGPTTHRIRASVLAAQSKAVHDAVYAKKFVPLEEANEVLSQMAARNRNIW